jgi:hypothetical protein
LGHGPLRLGAARQPAAGPRPRPDSPPTARARYPSPIRCIDGGLGRCVAPGRLGALSCSGQGSQCSKLTSTQHESAAAALKNASERLKADEGKLPKTCRMRSGGHELNSMEARSGSGSSRWWCVGVPCLLLGVRQGGVVVDPVGELPERRVHCPNVPSFGPEKLKANVPAFSLENEKTAVPSFGMFQESALGLASLSAVAAARGGTVGVAYGRAAHQLDGVGGKKHVERRPAGRIAVELLATGWKDARPPQDK